MVIVVLVILWVVVLAPGLVRRFRERRADTSIDSFHEQLHLLERSGPWLERAGARAGQFEVRPGTRAPPTRRTPGQPNLMLLRPFTDGAELPDSAEEVVDESSGEHYLRMPPPAPPSPPTLALAPAPAAGGPPVDRRRRRQTQRRRRDLVVSLAATVVLTGLLGIVDPVLWALTVIGVLGLLAYAGLAAYAQLIEEDRRMALQAYQFHQARPFDAVPRADLSHDWEEQRREAAAR